MHLNRSPAVIRAPSRSAHRPFRSNVQSYYWIKPCSRRICDGAFCRTRVYSYVVCVCSLIVINSNGVVHLVVSSSAQLLALATGTSSRRRRREALEARASNVQLDYSSRSLVELLLLTVTQTPIADATSGGTSSVTVAGQSTAIFQVLKETYSTVQ